MDKARFSSMSTRLLARYGGDVVLSRAMPGAPPAEPWMPPNSPVIVTETVKFVSTAVDTSLVAANMVLADDLVGMMQPPIGPLGEPMPGDMVRIDSTLYTLLSVAPVDSEPGSVIHFAIHGRTA